jgi:osmoprotectant transport system ATP-binding protein
MTFPQQNGAAIEFQGVRYSARGNLEVLRGIDLVVPRGQTTILLGRSGSGKTTLIKLANALFYPTSGEVHVDGLATRTWDAIQLRRGIGYVIQEAGLFPHFTVSRNISVVPRMLNWDSSRIEARTAELLDLVGLSRDIAGRYPRELSGGQRQRVGVARALAADPPILLMDEPFGALDPITRDELQREFKDLQFRLGKTVVFVTHDLREALLLGSRIALLEAGQLVAELPAHEFRTSTDPRVQRYLNAFADAAPAGEKRGSA